jgi:hypothetical protein
MIRTEWCWPWPLEQQQPGWHVEGREKISSPHERQYNIQRRCYYRILTLHHAWTTDGADAKVQRERNKNRRKSENESYKSPEPLAVPRGAANGARPWPAVRT